MALLKYFQKTSVLPIPNGPLSSHVPPSSIASANKEVKPLVDTVHVQPKAVGSFLYNYSDEEKIDQGAAEMGVTNTIRFLIPIMPLQE